MSDDLNRWIELHVFGDDLEPGRVLANGKTRRRNADPRDFCTDYRLCFEVLVPKMHEARYGGFQCGIDTPPGSSWAQFYPHVQCIDAPLTLAICRAAKAAVEARE